MTHETDLGWMVTKGDVAKQGVTYTIKCNLCKTNNIKTEYEGETGKNLAQRAKIHFYEITKDIHTNPLTTHKLTHQGDFDYSMQLKKGFKLAKERIISEGLNIEKSQADYLLNSKSEFHQPRVVRWRTVVNGEVIGSQGGGGLPNNNTNSAIHRQSLPTNRQSLTGESESETIISTNIISNQGQAA